MSVCLFGIHADTVAVILNFRRIPRKKSGILGCVAHGACIGF